MKKRKRKQFHLELSKTDKILKHKLNQQGLRLIH